MTLLERDERMREEGREEGLREGREEGLKDGREEGLKEGRVKEHIRGLRVLIRTLRKYTENEQDLLDEIMKHPEYSDITPDEIRVILEECVCTDK